MAGIKFSFCCSFDYINYIASLPLFLQNTTKIFAPNIVFIYDLREQIAPKKRYLLVL